GDHREGSLAVRGLGNRVTLRRQRVRLYIPAAIVVIDDEDFDLARIDHAAAPEPTSAPPIAAVSIGDDRSDLETMFAARPSRTRWSLSRIAEVRTIAGMGLSASSR